MELDRSLLRAIAVGTVEDVRSALQDGANPNGILNIQVDEADDPIFTTPTFYAIVYREATDRDVKLRLLLDAGASLTDRLRGLTPLGKACQFCDLSAVQILLSCGADVNNSGSFHGVAMTPLHIAAGFENAEICLMLLQNGADVNSKLALRGFQPLHLATARGNACTVRVLLANGACTNATNDDSLTPLHFAAIMDSGESMARLLVEHGADLSATSTEGKTALQHAVMSGHHAAASVLMEAHGQQLLKCDHVHPTTWAHVLAKVGERSTDMSRVGIFYSLLCEKPDLFGYRNAGSEERKRPDRFVPGV